MMVMKSLIGCPNTHCAVLVKGVLLLDHGVLYGVCVNATMGISVLSDDGLTVFIPISARQFECGKTADDWRWCSPDSGCN